MEEGRRGAGRSGRPTRSRTALPAVHFLEALQRFCVNWCSVQSWVFQMADSLVRNGCFRTAGSTNSGLERSDTLTRPLLNLVWTKLADPLNHLSRAAVSTALRRTV